MRIIITSPSLDPQVNVSGISAITKFIIDANSGNNYSHFEIGKKDEEKRDGRWLLRILQTYCRWIHTLYTNKDSLIHFNLSLDNRSLIRDSPLLLLARLFRVRIVVHIHGGLVLTRDSNPWWIRQLLKLNFSNRYPKVVLSSLEEDILRKMSNSDNIFVLPNCIRLADADSFKRIHNHDKPLRLLFMGRIVATKGLDYIYLALKGLKEGGIPFKFVMAGKGADEDSYVPQFEALLGDDFEFKGIVSGEEKNAVLRDSDAFLLPSFFEGLPIALLEAMSFGLVPITTNVGSIKHVVSNDNNGMIVKTHSWEDITDAVESLTNNREHMQELSANARSYIFENYNSTSYVSSLNRIYNYDKDRQLSFS
jgi:glycosyltransferase involved in cell wall biosynthesis